MDEVKSSKIKVSVIIPVYNVEKYLKECLDSIINQTLKDIEIICVDDGSSDNSLEILNEYAKKDDRITILTQKNKGAGAARNRGLEIAKGEFLYFLDSDDYLKYDALEKIYEKITTVNAEICVFKNDIYRQSTGIVEPCDWEKLISNVPNKETFNKYDIPNALFQFCSSPAWIKMYKASFVKNNKIKFQNLKICNDVYFNCMTLIKADSITFLNETLMTWRTQHSCITATRGKYVYCVIDAYMAIKNKLNKDDFELLSDTFYKRVRESLKYGIKKVEEQNKKDYWTLKLFKFLPKEYWTEQAIELKKQNTLFKKIFSIQNNGIHKVICISGIKFKIKSKKLQKKQEYERFKRRLLGLEKKLKLLEKQQVTYNEKLENCCAKDIYIFNNKCDNINHELKELHSNIDKIQTWQRYFYKDFPDEFPVSLSEIEKQTILEYLKNSKNYLEFGSGGSTFLALKNTDTKIYSIESDKKWLDYLRSYKIIREAEECGRLNFYHIFIGQIKNWGYPVSDNYRDNYPSYSSEIFRQINPNIIDTCLIDGRFRVACALQAALCCPNMKNLMMHDYTHREYYHIIEEFYNIVDTCDTLAVFDRKSNINIDRLNDVYEEYKYIKW